MGQLFELRGALDKRPSRIFNIMGIVILILMWQAICLSGVVSPSSLPSPIQTLKANADLFGQYNVVDNALYSLKLNLLGYLAALLVGVPIGFALGLLPICREMFEKQFDAARFLPLTAITGVFVAWFGIGDSMKIMFLAVSIFLYLVPVTVQRIREVEQVFVDTVVTLSATKWQIVRTVFIPQVMSKVWVDVKNLVAISWTYIIVAELLNRTNGLGSTVYIATRGGRMDVAFMALITIIFIGFLQDRFFGLLDKIFFPFKHNSEK